MFGHLEFDSETVCGFVYVTMYMDNFGYTSSSLTLCVVHFCLSHFLQFVAHVVPLTTISFTSVLLH